VTTVALKGLFGRKLRTVLTAFSIVLGVAMISGAYVLTDTITKAFDTIFTQSYRNADVVITGKAAFTNRNGNGVDTPTFPASLLAKVNALPDVGAAAGSVTDDRTQLVGRNGKTISNGGAPNLAFGVNTRGDQRFNPLSLTEGRWPVGPTEIAIDKATANKKHFKVGDTIGV
jgi:putative ABC transport system permease protein